MRQRFSTAAVLAVAAILSFASTLFGQPVRQSVVKIFSTKSTPKVFRPWEMNQPSEATGTGVLIDKNRILTNAHVVSYSQQVYVQPNDSSEKLDATVEFLSEDCDLATLTIDDPEAIKNLKPVPMADDLPEPKTKVSVLGYPIGGDTLSVTEGVVSRIEWAAYNYGTSSLRIQVDAPINPGNSGGPAIVDDEITGIVFSRFPEGENIGYLIPAETIRHFLDDWTSDGKYDGFPKIGIANDTTLENPALRDYLGLSREQTGVLVTRIMPRKELTDLLKPWDVITACDGVDIDNLGMITIQHDIRVTWGYLIGRKPPGSSLVLNLIRDGKELEVEIPTVTYQPTIVQRMEHKRPTYFIYGGIVFSPVTYEMLQSIPAQFLAALGARGSLLIEHMHDMRDFPDEELVVSCSPILPHKINKGYNLTPLSVVTHVNDQPVKNLRHLIKLIKENEKPFVVLEFEAEKQNKIVLEPEAVGENMSDILRNYVIPGQCSEDLEDVCP